MIRPTKGNINLIISIEEAENLLNAPMGFYESQKKMKSITEKDKFRIELKKVGDHWDKANCKSKGFEQAYIINCKLEKLFKWVLEK